jgi:hypothetical protein
VLAAGAMHLGLLWPGVMVARAMHLGLLWPGVMVANAFSYHLVGASLWDENKASIRPVASYRLVGSCMGPKCI